MSFIAMIFFLHLRLSLNNLYQKYQHRHNIQTKYCGHLISPFDNSFPHFKNFLIDVYKIKRIEFR